jgi:type I restriction-modification system DNA methylase subunit
MSNLKIALQKLVAQAKTRDIYNLSEMQVQSSYVVKVLEMLDWNDGGMAQGDRQDVATGKVPDILLKDANKWTLLVVECKDAGNAKKLDGYYGSGKNKKSFEQQLINYCKAEGVYWGVLTNFIEWRLYTVKHGQIYQNKKYAFHDLLWQGTDKSGYIDLLSPEGLAFLNTFKRHPFCKAQGLITQDKIYYPEEKSIRDDFFLMLKDWRESLRSELWTKNNQLLPDKEKIDLYAQKILDRMIFIDVCHDKRIIGPNAHDSILYTKKQVYDELKKWFVTMDDRFNTDLFENDKYINGFEISNEILAPIVSELASVDFSRLPVNIIGDVYEDYLGEMLRGGKKQGLKVREDKAKFKRKSQGIYYTPEYIVDYIVTNTVGELLNPSPSGREPALSEAKEDGKRKWAGERSTPGAGTNPKSLPREGRDLSFDEIKKIKVLDPACGSGSFLINAFDRFHAAYKKAAPDKKDFDIKRTILQHNLYGVDLDQRAVEICKLNLMLKALDKHRWDELKGRKLLPSLHLNIRHGNSLISGKSLADQEQLNMFNVYETDGDVVKLLKLHKQFYKASDDAVKHKLWDDIQSTEITLNRRLNGNLADYFSKPDEQHPLNFEVLFPEVFEQGGFDAVIGNPPYVRREGLGIYKNYFSANYKVFDTNSDLYVYFVEKSVGLLNKNGYFSFIVPNKWFRANYGKQFRKWVLEKEIVKLIDFGDLPVFDQVTIYPCIIVIKSGAPRKSFSMANVETIDFNRLSAHIEKIQYDIDKNVLDGNIWILKNVEETKLINKVKIAGIPLIKLYGLKVLRGIITGLNEAFIINEETKNKIINQSGKCKELIKPYLVGKDINRYLINDESRYLILIPNGWTKNNSGAEKDKWAWLEKNYKPLAEHLSQFKTQAMKRYDMGEYWWELRSCVYYNEFEKKKICWGNLCDRAAFTLDTEGYYINAPTCILTTNDKFILAVLNSKLLWWYLKSIAAERAGGFIEAKPMYVEQLPIKIVTTTGERQTRDKIVKLATEILGLNKTKLLRENNRIKITAVDHEIDQIVYRLYGLSEAEIKVVEGT